MFSTVLQLNREEGECWTLSFIERVSGFTFNVICCVFCFIKGFWYGFRFLFCSIILNREVYKKRKKQKGKKGLC